MNDPHAAPRRLRVFTITILLLAPRLVAADTLWWFGDTDHRWMEPLNWELAATHQPALPMDDQATYITTSDHPGLDLPSLPPSTVETGDVAITGQLYIGGWPSNLDGHHGDPLGRTGTLDITGGDLTVGWADSGAPPCYYVRLGYRGADGFIRQSGGRIYTCTFISMGFWSSQSTGTYELSGGTVETLGLDIGVQGIGVLNMSGGEITRMQSYGPGGTIPNERTNVGRSYFHTTTGFIPGSGFVNQSGGSITTHRLQVGLGLGSAGILNVRGPDSSVHAVDRLYIGEGGSGALVQTGGSVQAGSIYLGRITGGMGQYTVAGGTILVDGAGSGNGFFNGSVNAGFTGAGNLTIVGSSTPVNGGFQIASRYDQSARSRLNYLYDDGPGKITIIWVGGTATFQSGALLDIGPVDASVASLTPGQGLNLMVADRIVDNGIVVGNPTEWSIHIVRDVPFFGATVDLMQAIYCAGC